MELANFADADLRGAVLVLCDDPGEFAWSGFKQRDGRSGELPELI